MPLPGTREDGEWGTWDQLGQRALVSPGQPDVTKPPQKRKTGDEDSTRQSLPGSRQSPSTEVQTHALQADCPGSASSPPGAAPCPLAPPSPAAKVSPRRLARALPSPSTHSPDYCGLGPACRSHIQGRSPAQPAASSPLLRPSAPWPAFSTTPCTQHPGPRPATGCPSAWSPWTCTLGHHSEASLDPPKSPQPRGHWAPWASCPPARSAPGAAGALTGGSSCARGARLGRVTSFCRGCDELPPTQWPRTTQVLLIIPGVQEASTGPTALTSSGRRGCTLFWAPERSWSPASCCPRSHSLTPAGTTHPDHSHRKHTPAPHTPTPSHPKPGHLPSKMG